MAMPVHAVKKLTTSQILKEIAQDYLNLSRSEVEDRYFARTNWHEDEIPYSLVIPQLPR